MSLWEAKPIDEEPSIHLRNYKVLEIASLNGPSTRHVIGDNMAGGGRVSSPIETFNKNTRTITTVSGRKYNLLGPSGISLDAEYVWKHWALINKVTSTKDVTKEYE